MLVYSFNWNGVTLNYISVEIFFLPREQNAKLHELSVRTFISPDISLFPDFFGSLLDRIFDSVRVGTLDRPNTFLGPLFSLCLEASKSRIPDLERCLQAQV